MRYRVSLLTLAAMLLVPGAGRAQSTPPLVDTVLKADTLTVVGSSDTWRTRYFEGGTHSHTWIELEDPYGGRVYVPTLYYLSIATDVTAFVEDEAQQSVLFIRRPLIFPLLLFFVVGLLTVVAYPFVRYRRRFRRERERRRHLDEIRHQLAGGREAERLRLAQELHDGSIQDLHALRMRLSILTRLPTTGDGAPPDVSETLGEVVEEVQRVIRGLRGVSEDLRPPALGPFGLAAALHAFTERFRQAHPSIHVDLTLDDDGQALPEQVRLALFRIAQEAMNNAAKHGAPDRLDVVLRLDDARVLLEVCDDGRGYQVPDDFSHLGKNGHYGLLGMAERADFIGAELQVESHPGSAEPTRVRVVAPRTAPEWQSPLMTSKV